MQQRLLRALEGVLLLRPLGWLVQQRRLRALVGGSHGLERNNLPKNEEDEENIYYGSGCACFHIGLCADDAMADGYGAA